jgi:small GTP-binding protein
MGCKLTKNNL